jgi:Rrf2 family protein
MIEHSTDENISVHVLAKQFDVSPTYLSKILTQLSKAGIIGSTSGVKGGYILGKNPLEITFFDVIQAIEGNTSFFTCAVHEDKESQCGIRRVMAETNQLMEDFLRQSKLVDVIHKD